MNRSKHRSPASPRILPRERLLSRLGSWEDRKLIVVHGPPAEKRLYFSLAGAIFVATVSNFIWNRKWTWEDRKGKTNHGVLVQLGQYFIACGVSIAVQYLFTILLSRIVHYVAANLLSIGIAALINYALNDVWTFALAKRGVLQKQSAEKKIRGAEPIGKK